MISFKFFKEKITPPPKKKNENSIAFLIHDYLSKQFQYNSLNGQAPQKTPRRPNS